VMLIDRTVEHRTVAEPCTAPSDAGDARRARPQTIDETDR
jgi:hypothetical protein